MCMRGLRARSTISHSDGLFLWRRCICRDIRNLQWYFLVLVGERRRCLANGFHEDSDSCRLAPLPSQVSPRLLLAAVSFFSGLAIRADAAVASFRKPAKIFISAFLAVAVYPAVTALSLRLYPTENEDHRLGLALLAASPAGAPRCLLQQPRGFDGLPHLLCFVPARRDSLSNCVFCPSVLISCLTLLAHVAAGVATATALTAYGGGAAGLAFMSGMFAFYGGGRSLARVTTAVLGKPAAAKLDAAGKAAQPHLSCRLHVPPMIACCLAVCERWLNGSLYLA